jgi:catechol 2,3-dioxygenase-like lactoylglutathione lyase family enzyme
MRVFPGISVVTLGVRNVERATIFYESLGWRLSRRSSRPAVSFFHMNNLVLELRPSDALARRVGIPDDGGEDGLVVLGQHYGGAESVAHALERARTAGGQIVRPVRSLRTGAVRGSFADPDNHVWNIVFDPRHLPGHDGSVSLAP